MTRVNAGTRVPSQGVFLAQGPVRLGGYEVLRRKANLSRQAWNQQAASPEKYSRRRETRKPPPFKYQLILIHLPHFPSHVSPVCPNSLGSQHEPPDIPSQNDHMLRASSPCSPLGVAKAAISDAMEVRPAVLDRCKPCQAWQAWQAPFRIACAGEATLARHRPGSLPVGFSSKNGPALREPGHNVVVVVSLAPLVNGRALLQVQRHAYPPSGTLVDAILRNVGVRRCPGLHATVSALDDGRPANKTSRGIRNVAASPALVPR